MSDFEDRAARGLEVLSTLTGSEEGAANIAGFFEAQGAIGSIALRTGAGDVWSRPQFSRRDRSLVVIGILSALGREVELRQHVGGGLNHGLGRDEVDEIMVQLAPYVGVPFALGGAGVVASVFAELDGAVERRDPPAPMEAKDDAGRRADGKDVLRTLLGMPAEALDFAADATVEQLGDMGAQVLDYAFGEVWSRPQLARRDRSLVVISALAALALPHELDIHIGGALQHGVTRVEVEEVMMTLVVYGGFPRAIDGLHVAQKVFAALDAPPET
jgi:4-carboxymuconolactone decarboxylase